MLPPDRCDTSGVLRVAAVVEQCWHRVPGGTAVAAVCTLEAIAARGDVELVGVAAAHRGAPSLAPPAGLDIHHLRLPRRVLYDSWHYLRMPRISGVGGGVDVVHATGGVVPPVGSSALVVTINDLAFLHHPEWFTPRGVRFAIRALELARSHAAVMLTPSQATANDLVDHGVESSRVRVAMLGVHPHKVTSEDEARVRQRFGLPETFALWVGTAEPRKNLECLLRAAGRTTSRIPLVLAGPSGWGLDLNELRAETTSEVMWLGFVQDRDLPALYAAAHVFVFPSLMEGFGLPVLEAMAQGTPVVTSAGTATAEVCADERSLVDPTDSDALANAIDAVVLDNHEHRRRSRAAQLRANQLTWSNTARGVVAAYRDAAT